MDSSLPLVSIVIPIRNEAQFIDRCLRSVFNQDYPPDRMEVIIADGMSTDNTPDIIQSFQRQHLNMILLDNPKKIVPAGFNAAVRRSSGEIILRVDGHSELATDYLRRCVQHLMDSEADVVGGVMETSSDNFTGRAIAQAISSKFGVGGSFRAVKQQTKYVDTIAFAALGHHVIDIAGLYDEEMICNEDDEYFYRLRKMGFRILLAADAHVRYFGRSSIRGLWHQYFRYGLWKVRVWQKHPQQMRPRQFIPALFVLTLALASIFGVFFPSCRFMLYGALGTYVCVNIIVSFWIAWRSDWRYFLLLPLIFMTIHFSYGSGFLIGLIRFANHWGTQA